MLRKVERKYLQLTNHHPDMYKSFRETSKQPDLRPCWWYSISSNYWSFDSIKWGRIIQDMNSAMFRVWIYYLMYIFITGFHSIKWKERNNCYSANLVKHKFQLSWRGTIWKNLENAWANKSVKSILQFVTFWKYLIKKHESLF